MLDAHKVLHAYLYGTRLLLCFPKHFERMCAVCVNTGSNIDCKRKRVAALSVPFENIYLYIYINICHFLSIYVLSTGIKSKNQDHIFSYIIQRFLILLVSAVSAFLSLSLSLSLSLLISLFKFIYQSFYVLISQFVFPRLTSLYLFYLYLSLSLLYCMSISVCTFAYLFTHELALLSYRFLVCFENSATASCGRYVIFIHHKILCRPRWLDSCPLDFRSLRRTH